MLKHTPGPWTIKIHLNEGRLDGHLYELCIKTSDYTELKANARLIKAAPELYKTAYEMIRYLTDTMEGPTKNVMLAQVLAAIDLVEKDDAGH